MTEISFRPLVFANRNSVQRRKEENSYSKRHLPENYSSCIPSPRIGSEWLSVVMTDARWPRRRTPGGVVTPGGLDDGHRGCMCETFRRELEAYLQANSFVIS